MYDFGPSKQFEHDKLKIVYYENLGTQLETELPAIFASIRKITKL
jgi:hypothetical protein